MKRYLLDKNAHVYLEKEGVTLPDRFDVFVARFVCSEVPRALMNELHESNYAIYSSVGAKVSNISIPPPICSKEGDLTFSYVPTQNIGCKEIIIQNIGKVESVDVELVVFCVKNDCILVTNDKRATHLAESLGVEVVSFSKFMSNAIDWVNRFIN